MPDPANGILRALPEHLLVQASAQRHFHPIRFQILAPPALAASAPRRGNRSADPQPDQPKAQIPIAHRVRPAGSCMLGFRTLKRPKSFDDPERRLRKRKADKLPFLLVLVGVSYAPQSQSIGPSGSDPEDGRSLCCGSQRD